MKRLLLLIGCCLTLCGCGATESEADKAVRFVEDKYGIQVDSYSEGFSDGDSIPVECRLASGDASGEASGDSFTVWYSGNGKYQDDYFVRSIKDEIVGYYKDFINADCKVFINDLGFKAVSNEFDKDSSYEDLLESDYKSVIDVFVNADSVENENELYTSISQELGLRGINAELSVYFVMPQAFADLNDESYSEAINSIYDSESKWCSIMSCKFDATEDGVNLNVTPVKG